MKQIKITTNKGEFLVVDMQQGAENLQESLRNVKIESYKSKIKLSEITEEEASEIVDNPFESVSNKTNLMIYIQDKGIHLFRKPLNIGTSIDDYDLYKQAEQKTFYNPYIFKL